MKSVADSAILGERVITDDAGREIKIPTADNIKSVFFTSGLAQVYITSLCPDLLGGTASKFTKGQLKFLPKGMEDLPYLGTINNNGEIDRESLLTEDIDIMFSISGIGLTQQNISEAKSLQQQTGIPVVLIDGSFTKIPKAFRFLGDILDRKERAEELARYCEESYKVVHDVVATIPMEERITLYYAEGPEGLQTEPETSQHMLGFLEGGALDAAKCEETYGGGMTDVSLEQVLKWDPEVIVAWDTDIRGGAIDDIRTNPDWSEIQAVKNGRIYSMPNEPWAWCDRPPGVNRILGIHWIANLLYPDIYDVDMKEIVRDYFKVMYEVDISDADILGLLGNSYPPPPRQNSATSSAPNSGANSATSSASNSGANSEASNSASNEPDNEYNNEANNNEANNGDE
ncbi:MAG: ABC transporter substrate-binding protein [Clostridiales Family XIII bacterium]|jgi:iron complex transport system substrate-binding protein|nr:ABC transporter substrate-binding protein [Clostridiales Family XIII bacterium]